MKLKSPEIERHLRRQARREMRHSPALWKEYRRHRVRWWRRTNWSITVFSWGYLALILMAGAYRSGQLTSVLVVLSLYATATALTRTGIHLTQGLVSGDRLVLFALPVSDEEYLERQTRKLYWSWAAALVIFMVGYGIDAGAAHSLRQNWVVVVATAALQAVTGVCLGGLIRLYAPRSADYRVQLSLWGLIVACWFLPAAGIRNLWSAVLLTPSGWISHGYAALVGRAAQQEILLFLPAILVAACWPFVLPRLRKQALTELQSQTLDGPIAKWVGHVSGTVQAERAADSFPGASAQSGRLFEAADWARTSWLERLVGAWLTNHEKLVAEFMLGGQLGSWSTRWRYAAFFTAGGLVLTFAPPSLPVWLPFMPLLIAAMSAAPILGGYWLGFHSPFPLMQSVPVYAAFPISFDEITSVMLKASALRTLAWSPLFIGYTAILGLRVSVPFEYGIEVGIKVILVVMAWQLLAVVGHFTWNHASTSKPMTWRYILTVICGLCVVGAFTASAITMFNAATSLFKAAAIAGMFVSSVTGWALYRWRFNRGRVDLVTIPQAR